MKPMSTIVHSLIWEMNQDLIPKEDSRILLGCEEDLTTLLATLEEAKSKRSLLKNGMLIASAQDGGFFSTITYLQPQKIIIFGENRHHLEWTMILTELIRKSRSRKELIESIFCRSYSPENPHAICQQPFSSSIQKRGADHLKDYPSLQEIYLKISKLLEQAVPISIENDSGEPIWLLSYQHASQTYFLGTQFHSMLKNCLHTYSLWDLNHGFLASDDQFRRLRTILRERPPDYFWTRMEDLPLRLWTGNYSHVYFYTGTIHARNPESFYRSILDWKRAYFYDESAKDNLLLITAYNGIFHILTQAASQLDLTVHPQEKQWNEFLEWLFSRVPHTRLALCQLTESTSILLPHFMDLHQITPGELMLKEDIKDDVLFFSNQQEIHTDWIALLKWVLQNHHQVFLLMPKPEPETRMNLIKDKLSPLGPIATCPFPLFLGNSGTNQPYLLFHITPQTSISSNGDPHFSPDNTNKVDQWRKKHAFLQLIETSIAENEIDRAILAGTEAYHIFPDDPDFLRPYLWAMIQIGAFSQAYEALCRYRENSGKWDDELETILNHLESSYSLYSCKLSGESEPHQDPDSEN